MEEKLIEALNLIDSEGQRIQKDFVKKIEKKKRIEESYGSFKGQYDIARNIASEIISKYKKGKFESDWTIVCKSETEKLGNIEIIANVNDQTYGVNGVSRIDKNSGKNIIELQIGIDDADNTRDLAYTISHEIMHQFQQRKLKKFKGANEKSATLYFNVIRFYDEATPSSFSEFFFYSLYSCFSPEVYANISAVSNYIDYIVQKTKEEEINGEWLTCILKTNTTYNAYNVTIARLENVTPTEEDKRYITKCMTSPMRSPFHNQPVILYDKETFNVDKFINQNKKNIIKICKETINKMQKNVMNYFDIEKR